MKKIVCLGALILVSLLSLAGCSYYKDTYQGETYYAIVPQETPEKEETKDNQGKVVPNTYTYSYDLTWADAKGNTIEFEAEVSGENPEPLTPGSYVSAEISKKRIVKGPNYVKKEEIPENALKKIQ